MVTVSLDSPSCEVTLFDPVFGGLSGRYPTGQGIIPFEARWSPQEWTHVLELVFGSATRCAADWSVVEDM
jgi:hypothetical protein